MKVKSIINSFLMIFLSIPEQRVLFLVIVRIKYRENVVKQLGFRGVLLAVLHQIITYCSLHGQLALKRLIESSKQNSCVLDAPMGAKTCIDEKILPLRLQVNVNHFNETLIPSKYWPGLVQKMVPTEYSMVKPEFFIHTT